MFNSRENIVSAFELGTSKISVLIGRFEPGQEGSLEVIGFGEAPSNGEIVKGEIVHMENAFVQLGKAIEDADRGSGNKLNDAIYTTILATGSGIECHSCTGIISINSEDHCVTAADRRDAYLNARNMPIAADRTIISSAESYFILDSNNSPVRDPVNMRAHKLEAHALVVSGIGTRLKSFQEIVRDSGIETPMECVFSGMATDYGLLSEDERKNGVLMVDFGAGTTEYTVDFKSGQLCSGMLQIGFEHVLNDLSIGLGLPMPQMRKMAVSGELEKFFQERRPFLDVKSEIGRKRRIPLTSIETIVDARLDELFGLIADDLRRRGLLSDLGAGGVLTGGGALFSRSLTVMREVFDMPIRIGRPNNVCGSVTGLNDPRYSALWGALNLAEFYAEGILDNGGGKKFRGLFDGVDGAINKTGDMMKSIFKSFKV